MKPAAAPPEQASTTHRPVYRDHNLHIILSVTWTSMMGVGSLSPVLPSVMEAFQVSSQQVGLLITAFTLPGIFLSPVAGLLADRFGRKNVLVPSLLLFAAAGTACAFATDFEVLLALRVLQGCGGAALQVLNNTVLGDLYAGRRRMEAIGVNASVQNLATLSNPLLGGAVALAGWFYPFFLPLLAVPVAYLVAFHLDRADPAVKRQSLSGYFASAAAALRDRRMVALFLGSIVSVMISFGVLMVYLSLLMKQSFGASPLEIGFIVASSSIVGTVVSTQAARVGDHLSPRQMIVLGLALSSIGLALNPLMPGLWLLLLPALVKGISQGILNPPLYTLILEGAPVESRAGIMALNGSLHRVGQTVAPPFFGLCYALGGMNAVFEIGAGMLAVSAIAVGLMLGPTVADERAQRAHARR